MGFAFLGLAATFGRRRLHPNADRSTLPVDSGASDHLVDATLIPRLQYSMKDCKKLEEPKLLVTAGNKTVFATATGTIQAYINQTHSSTYSTWHTRCDRSCAGTQPPLLRQLNKIGGTQHSRDGKPPLTQFDCNTPLRLYIHPGGVGMYSYAVCLRALDVAIETSSPASVVAQTVTPQQNGASERHGQALTIRWSRPRCC